MSNGQFYVMLCELYLAAKHFRDNQKIKSTLKSSMQHGMKAQGQQAPPERKRMPSPVNQAHPPDLLVVAEIKRERNWPVNQANNLTPIVVAKYLSKR